jgi:hypothetical protein
MIQSVAASVQKDHPRIERTPRIPIEYPTTPTHHQASDKNYAASGFPLLPIFRNKRQFISENNDRRTGADAPLPFGAAISCRSIPALGRPVRFPVFPIAKRPDAISKWVTGGTSQIFYFFIAGIV